MVKILLALICGSACAFAQDTPTVPVAPDAPTAPVTPDSPAAPVEPDVVYSKVKVSPDIIAAALFAARVQGTAERSSVRLIAVNEAATNIGAGTKYRLTLRATQGGKPLNAKCDVARSPEGEYSLVSWSWE